MQPKAILLTLVGLISIVRTSPLAVQPSKSVPQVAAGVAVSDSLNASQTTAQGARLQQLQAYCRVSTQDAGCLAYNEMVGVANAKTVPNFDHTISEELAKVLSASEVADFCGVLSETLKNLPPSLSTKALIPFQSILACVSPCYTKDSELKDVCRAIFAGYKLILESIGKQEPKQHSQSMQVADANKPENVKPIPSIAAIVPAVAKMPERPTEDEVKGKSPIPLSMDTKNSVKKGSLDELPNPAPIIPNLSSGDASKTKKPEGEIKEGVVGEGDGAAVAPKLAEKAQKEPSPVQLPQEAVAPEKNEGDLEQQQGGGMDGIAGDLAPFDDEPKQPVDQDAKGGTQPVYENSDESDGIASAEDVNENGDDLEINGFQPVAKPEQPEKEKQEELADGSKASDIVPGADPFYEQKDSNFFPFFLFVMFFLAMLYVAYHNKTKLLALVLEGWRTNSGRRGFSKGRKHTAAYRKLDSNLEEAITSGSSSGGHSSTQIIY